ncbi:MAG: hypothetical protein JWO94_1573 [Verrucomicrobiaceae bacterium]|nr:hypothetical protein [Verrucomicrobiaceae bacterium]
MLFSQNIDPSNSGGRRFFLFRWLISLWQWLVPPTLAHQDRQSRTSRLVAAWTLVGLCVAAMGLTLAYARPIYGQYKEWRSGKLVKQAREMRDTGDIVGAVVTAGKAVNLSPEFEPAVRLNAEILTMISQEQALYFWDKLTKMGVTGLDDEMGRVRALQRTHRNKEAAQLLESLLQQHPADTRLMMLGDDVWGQRSNDVQMAVLTDYYTKHPDNREIGLRLLKLELQSHAVGESEISEGLWQLAEGEDEISLDALRKLADLETLEGPARERLADRLDQHSLSGEAERMQALSIRVALRPARKNLLMDEAIARVRSLDLKPDKLVPMVRWLVVHREPGRILSLVTENDIKKDEQLLTNYLNALTILGRNADLARIVNDRSFTLRAATRTFYQAHLALVNGEPRDQIRSKLLLVRDDLSAGGQGDMLLLLGNYCQEREFYDVAESAFEFAAMSSRVRVERSGFASWIKCCKISGNTDALLRAASEASRRWPDDQSFTEDSLYAKLLQGVEIETSLSRAENLLAANPKDATRKLLTALGYLRLSSPENSVNACQDLNLIDTSAGQHAVFAAIFHDAGAQRVTQGDETLFRRTLQGIISEIPPKARMLPEEAAMLRRAQE